MQNLLPLICVALYGQILNLYFRLSTRFITTERPANVLRRN